MPNERRSFCKDLLAGKCFRGTHCKFRHQGPERPPATAYGCEQLPALDTGPPGTLTLLGQRTSLVTLDAGAKLQDHKLVELLGVGEVKTYLEVSWRKPTRTVDLRYDDPGIVFRVTKAFHGIKIYGLQLGSQLAPIYVPKTGLVRGVRISNVPEAVDEKTLLELAPGCPRPAHISFGRPTYRAKAGPDIVCRKLKATAAATALQIIKYDLNLPQNGDPSAMTQSVIIEMKDTSQLETFARQCNNMGLPDLGHGHLKARTKWDLVLLLPRQKYLGLEQRLHKSMSQSKRISRINVEVHHNPSADQTTKILLRGSKHGVTDAKAALESVIARDISRQLEQLQKHRLATWRKGATSAGLQTHRIKLTQTITYKRALKALDAARAAVGGDKAMLDDDSDPPAIVVTGPAKILRVVQAILFPETGHHEEYEASTCAICFDEDETLIRLPKCGHKCCQDCFQQYCTIDIENKLPLRCFDAACEAIMPIELIVKHLKASDLDLLADASAELHLKSNPDIYVKCPAINCSGYYTASSESLHLMCTTCCTTICTQCNVPLHNGEMCREYQERVSGHLAQLQEYLDSGKAKRCPKCTVVIEKDAGCNHMTCINCYTHFCFECLAATRTGDELYRHLIDVHGSYGDPENEQLMAHIDAVYDELGAELRAMAPPLREADLEPAAQAEQFANDRDNAPVIDWEDWG
ncbi:hypothetical protein EJ03DRAFT_89184 [Teratosphaeria nubilosa]|uniref:RBR-type E3 ubiquitin transferase n=1 Tax=Teratosphaeria nubilosa TaxID=161662 RepID=A0A6G1LAY2_9PEZI|nr:hypothetical protein EJ03DRAFT_89184 [Teratosphaeria nubilosa]